MRTRAVDFALAILVSLSALALYQCDPAARAATPAGDNLRAAADAAADELERADVERQKAAAEAETYRAECEALRQALGESNARVQALELELEELRDGKPPGPADPRPVVDFDPARPLKADTIYDLRGRTFTLHKTVDVKADGVTIRGGSIVRANCDGSAIVAVTGDRVSVERVAFDTDRPLDVFGPKKVGATVVLVATGAEDVVVSDCTGDDVDSFVKVQAARNVKVLRCSTGRGARSYGVYCDGVDTIEIAGCTFDGSKNEHCIRFMGKSKHAHVHGNTLRQHNDVKGCIEARELVDAHIHDNELVRGQLRVGSYGLAPKPATPDMDISTEAGRSRQSSDMLIERNHLTGGAVIRIRPGAERITFKHNSATYSHQRKDPWPELAHRVTKNIVIIYERERPKLTGDQEGIEFVDSAAE